MTTPTTYRHVMTLARMQSPWLRHQASVALVLWAFCATLWLDTGAHLWPQPSYQFGPAVVAVYDRTGPLNLGSACSSQHGLSAGDVCVGGALSFDTGITTVDFGDFKVTRKTGDITFGPSPPDRWTIHKPTLEGGVMEFWSTSVDGRGTDGIVWRTSSTVTPKD